MRQSTIIAEIDRARADCEALRDLHARWETFGSELVEALNRNSAVLVRLREICELDAGEAWKSAGDEETTA